MNNFRTDIQALRGIAVLAVVAYHAKIIPDSGGYLGVDVFFVISGFLITSLIARALENDQFSFYGFYLRRAWRLLPAAYVVFGLCIIAAHLLLNDLEKHDFFEQAIGAIGFVANIVLWQQTGYFETAAEVKPLLHTWSLSLEEQYYLILPLLLIMLRPSLWLAVAILLSITSLVLMVLFFETMPGATFYLLPTRVWELGIGSVIALSQKSRFTNLPGWSGWAALCILIVILIRPLPESNYYEVNLLLATVCTAVIILSSNLYFNDNVVSTLLAKVGAISYSLYLVHWPILAFLQNMHVGSGGLQWEIRLVAIIISFIIAALLCRYVEQPFRLSTNNKHKRTAKPLIIFSIVLSCIALYSYIATSESNFKHRFRVNTGLDINCNSLNFDTLPTCRNTNNPNTLVWGDSFAMHLVPGLDKHGSNILQATKSTCSPLVDYALYSPPLFNKPWALDCTSFSKKAFTTALNNADIKTIIMASQWGYIINAPVIDSRETTKTMTVGMIANNIIKSANELMKAGKEVIVVDRPPSLGFDIARCHERLEKKLPLINGTESCLISVPQFKESRKFIDELMATLKSAGLTIYSFNEHLCNNDSCQTKIDNVILYRDSGHLSIEGSEYLLGKYPILTN